MIFPQFLLEFQKKKISMDFYQSSLQEFLSEIFKFPPVFCFRYSYSDFPEVSADIFIEFLSCFLLEIFLGFLSWFFCGDLHGISLRSFPEFLPLTFFIDFSRSSLRDFFRIQTKICPRDFREYCWFLDCSRHLSRISPRMFFLGLFSKMFAVILMTFLLDVPIEFRLGISLEFHPGIFPEISHWTQVRSSF